MNTLKPKGHYREIAPTPQNPTNSFILSPKFHIFLCSENAMGITPKEAPSLAYTETLEEIMKTYKSLPPRPTIEEIEAANSVLKTVSSEENQKLEEISKQSQSPPPPDVPPELFSLLLQARKTMVLFQSHEQRKEALHLVELDKIYNTFDEIIQKTCKIVSGDDTQLDKEGDFEYPVGRIEKEVVISDGSLILKKKDEGLIKNREAGELKGDSFKGLLKSSSAKGKFTSFPSGGGETEKLSLMQVAALIETIAKKGGQVLDLQGKLMDKIEWLPVSLGKLSNITELNVSDNKIMALPSTIGSLTALTKLDIHANQLINLPDSFGQLVNLTDLDLHANRLKSLPDSFGELINLTNLDLSSNYFTILPDIIGKLASLKVLIVETNELEELPYTIGSCSSLVELRLDFNQLKALPEAIGKLECLEILTLHYNRVRKLPTTMANLTRLRELDLSFNEIEAIPESLCFVVSLEKLNVGKNFADLRALPRSIGNLENLEELDISDDQIRVLPDSFGLLSKLRIFRAHETPLEVPPMEVTKLGAQAVVEYMADLASKRGLITEVAKDNKGLWSWICCFFCGK